MREAVIVSTARTGLAKSFRGGFNDTEAPAMGGTLFARRSSVLALIPRRSMTASSAQRPNRVRRLTISAV